MHLAAGLSDAASPPDRPRPIEQDDAALSAPPGVSSLTVLWPSDDPSSQLLLPELPDEDAPWCRSPATSWPAQRAARAPAVTSFWARLPAAAWAS